jgi:hypothetical protein
MHMQNPATPALLDQVYYHLHHYAWTNQLLCCATGQKAASLTETNLSV